MFEPKCVISLGTPWRDPSNSSSSNNTSLLTPTLRNVGTDLNLEATPRATLVFLAQTCELAERYDDAVVLMKAAVRLDPNLSILERNLLSISYKNVIGQRRASWRILCSIEAKEQERQSAQLERVQRYKRQVEKEISAGCLDLLAVLDDVLIPLSVHDEEARVSYLKMKADYHRYHSESTRSSPEHKAAAEQTYEAALSLAMRMPESHVVRLSLVLNYSVYLYEVLMRPERAVSLATTALDKAEARLSHTTPNKGDAPDWLQEVRMVLKLLRDNVTLWKEDQKRGGR